MPTEVKESKAAEDEAVDRVTIPDAKHAPEPEATPKHLRKNPNFADKEESVKKALAWIRDYMNDFKAQSARSVYVETEMDIADEMYRAAKTRTSVESDQSNNKEDTRSNVSSTAFNRAIRALTANEVSVILGNEDELPVVYEPLPGATEYREDEGQRIAQDQNATLAYTFNASKMRDVIRSIFLYVNKYANQLVGMKWDRRKEKRRDRVPVKFETDEATGMRRPVKWEHKVQERTVSDQPRLERYDMKDCWFDSMIDDIQDQSCVIIRRQKQLSDIWQLQRMAEFKNVDKITTAALHKSEGSESVLSDRQANASEDSDANSPTTLFDVYEAWIRLPINDETGAWEPSSELPHWYHVYFVGDLDGAPVCVKLSPNPYNCNRIPLLLFHSHEDDKGALHMGYSVLAKCLYMIETTILNQAIDNNTVRNQKPLIADLGSLHVRDMTFTAGGNRVWWKTPGADDPHEIEIQDTTRQTIPLLNLIQDYLKETMGTNKPFMGEALGQRTSASEAIGVLEQAVKPALEDAKYKANQLLPFIAEWNMELWRQFGDPELRLVLTQQNEQREVKPAMLWGPLSVRVTSIKRFQDGILRRKEEDMFLNQFFPLAQPYMSEEGIVNALSQIAKNRNYQDVDTWWKKSSDYDARRVARMENESILHSGVYDMPKQEENHAAHLAEHQPYLANYSLLPEMERDPENIRRMQLHIQVHEQMLAGSKQGAAQAAMTGAPSALGVEGVGGNGPRTQGEAVGDMLGAAAGAAEQPGRPPEIQNTDMAVIQ